MQRPLDALQLQQFLAEKVPLARAMGAQVLEASAAGVRMRFGLAQNINHHGTAFGGSLSAAGILAGWSLLHISLLAEGIAADTVVAVSTTRYLAPIAVDFEGVAPAPAGEKWGEFLDMLGRWGRSRIELRTELCAPGESAAAVHEGIYVATMRS